MLNKPNLPDQLLIDCLQRDFGLTIDSIDFLPIGADVNSAVYRAVAANVTPYFVKLRSGEFDELTIVVPHLLATQGISHLIAPIETRDGQLWSSLDRFAVILYPFIDGEDGFTVELSDVQWVTLGEVLKGVHTAEVLDEIVELIPSETFPTVWFERARDYLELFAHESFTDPISAKLAELMRTRREVIVELIRRAETCRQRLVASPRAFVLCHADIHGGNVLVTPDGDLYVVDWDTLLLAPKERDLMFIGGGIGKGWGDERGVESFYQGYGPAEVDPVGITYYRCERIVEDIVLYCEQILESEPDNPDRAQALVYVSSNFLPNETIEIAFRTDRTGLFG